MKSLQEALRLKKQLRVIGFDDAPFCREQGALVNISGIVCTNTRFEGMLWGETHKDGTDATEVIANMLLQSKFYQQVHLVLTDGIAVGGFNMIDLPQLAARLDKPCIAVMRKMPDLMAIDQALQNFQDCEQRRAILQKAGAIHQEQGFVFQVQGCASDTAAKALAQLTDTGNVPEPLRIAHFVGAAVKTGQSSNSA